MLGSRGQRRRRCGGSAAAAHQQQSLLHALPQAGRELAESVGRGAKAMADAAAHKIGLKSDDVASSPARMGAAGKMEHAPPGSTTGCVRAVPCIIIKCLHESMLKSRRPGAVQRPASQPGAGPRQV